MNARKQMLPHIMVCLLFFVSCSVKEDRSPCPCLLEIEFADTDAGIVELSVISGEGYVWKDTVDVGRNGRYYRTYVPRADLHIRAWSGTEGLAGDTGLLIPFGQDCPRVYMHDSDLRAQGEAVYEVVDLKKNHCVLTLTTEGEGRIPLDMVLRGNVAGYDEYGVPVPGEFEFLLEDGGLEPGYKAVLPRQTDASLMLEIDDGNGNRKAFALGQYIVSSGYDWNAPELDDVTVTLDYALTEIRLTVSGWESVYRYDVEI